ncbi:MAG: recombinase family protein [Bradyrhizobiaceae bacterium]|nr:recombinase family protein [Bradyrhizobiaceae bacterium]
MQAQREACEAFIRSQRHEGWKLLDTRYYDGGFSGGTMERPALLQLLEDIRARRIDVVVVYKVDRLTRALTDFAKIVETFDQHNVSFVSVTQQFNTTTSMGRLTLNVLLSFAQFEREVTGERIRDKIAASKKKGIGGRPFSRGHIYQILSNPIYVGEINHKGIRHPRQHKAIIDRETWDAVQTILQANGRERHVGHNAKEPSLLAGLLHDETGDRLAASHTAKGGRHYRYTISALHLAGPAHAPHARDSGFPGRRLRRS